MTLFLDWTEAHRLCDALAVRLALVNPGIDGPGGASDAGRLRHGWHGIVPIARGGLVPAALLARALDLRVIDTVCVETYTGRESGNPFWHKDPALTGQVVGDGVGWLVVDDLVDSGATMQLVRAVMPRVHTAVLIAKPYGRSAADSFVAEVPQGLWVSFPWERSHHTESESP